MAKSRPDHIFVFVIAAILFFAPSAHISAEQRIKIVRGYEGQKQYAEAAAGKSEEDSAALYRKFVAEPYRDCGRNLDGETEDMPDSRFAKPIVDLETLSATIDAIESNKIDSRILTTAEKAAMLLSAEDITICVFAYHPAGPELSFVKGAAGGVMGFAFFGEGMMWVDPLLLDDVDTEDWLSDIEFTTVHELHHAVGQSRTRKRSEKPSLLEFIVGEGRADTFVEIMYPGELPPWSSALSAAEESQVWPQMKASLESTDETLIGNYLFGSKEYGIPRWSGYTIGFRIVQSYLDAHPGTAVET